MAVRPPALSSPPLASALLSYLSLSSLDTKVLESVGKAKFGMRRYGDLSAPMNVRV